MMCGHYSAVVIKRYNQKHVLEGGVCLGLWFQGGKNPSWLGSMAAAMARMPAGEGS